MNYLFLFLNFKPIYTVGRKWISCVFTFKTFLFRLYEDIFSATTKRNLLRVKPSIKRLNETRKRETYLTKKVSSKVRKHCKRNKNKKVRFLLNEKSLLFHAAYILCTNSLILPFSVCLSVRLSVFQFLSWNERKKKTSSALLGVNVGFFFCWMQARKKATIINEF